MTFPAVSPHVRIPDRAPALDRIVADLTRVYRQAEAELTARLFTVLDDPRRFRQRARIAEQLAAIDSIVGNVEAEARSWVASQFPGVYEIGATDAATVMGREFGWTAPHREAVAILAGDTMDDLLHATRYMNREAKQAIRTAARAALPAAEVRGTTAVQKGRELRDRLRQSGLGHVVYRNGRVVSASTYAEMVARTKTALARNAGGLNLAHSLGVETFEIIDGNDCGLVSHSDGGRANGLIVDAATARQFPIAHPNCRRSFAPRPDLRPDQATSVDRYLSEPGVQRPSLSLRPAEQRADQAAFEAFLRSEQRGRQARKARRSRRAARRASTGTSARRARPRSSAPIRGPEPVTRELLGTDLDDAARKRSEAARKANETRKRRAAEAAEKAKRDAEALANLPDEATWKRSDAARRANVSRKRKATEKQLRAEYGIADDVPLPPAVQSDLAERYLRLGIGDDALEPVPWPGASGAPAPSPTPAPGPKVDPIAEIKVPEWGRGTSFETMRDRIVAEGVPDVSTFQTTRVNMVEQWNATLGRYERVQVRGQFGATTEPNPVGQRWLDDLMDAGAVVRDEIRRRVGAVPADLTEAVHSEYLKVLRVQSAADEARDALAAVTQEVYEAGHLYGEAVGRLLPYNPAHVPFEQVNGHRLRFAVEQWVHRDTGPSGLILKRRAEAAFEATREQGRLLSDALQSFAQAKRAVASRATQVVDDVLGEVRSFDSLVQKVTKPKSGELAGRVQDGSRHYPDAWVRRSNDEGTPVVAAKVRRGYYRDSDVVKINGRYERVSKIALSDRRGASGGLDALDRLGARTAPNGSPLGSDRVAIHEYGHRMEATIDGVKRSEYAFYHRRTAGERVEHMGPGYGAGEVTRPDKFAERYMGKVYEGAGPDSPYELLTMGSEELWSDFTRLDDDFLAWLLGTLALIP